MPSRCPRVLVITSDDIFLRDNSVSLTVKSILSSFPKDNISQIVCEDFNGRMTGRQDDCTFVLGHDSVWLGRFLKSEREVKTSLPGPEGIRKRTSIKEIVYRLFSAIYQSFPYKIDQRLENFISEKKPQVIYVILTPSRNNSLANKISKRFNLPIVPHFYDDWQKVYLTESIWLKPFKYVFDKKLEIVLRRAHTCLCISKKMCNAYEERFSGIEFIPLMHAVKDLSTIARTENHNQIRLIYSGSLYLGRYNSLVLLCNAIKKIDNPSIVLDVYCPNDQWKEVSNFFRSYSFVSHCGLIPQEEMFFRLRQADFLVFIESFDSQYLVYSSFSLSTKIPEYLSSMVPIIALGHKEQGSIEYLQKAAAAYVASDETMIDEICFEAFSHQNQNEIIENARRLYEQYHTRSASSSLILDVFNDAIKKNRR